MIHQATFTAGNWRGAADFLLKVRVPSELGPYSYEPADAKLATHPKPYVIFQLLFYAAMVGQAQGAAPERVHVVLGSDETRSFRPRDFQAYADRVQGRFFRTPAGLPQGRAAAVPVSRRALRLLRLVGALPRPPARGRPPVAGRRDHARAGDQARGRGGPHASPSSPTCRRARSVPGSRRRRSSGLRQQAWLQMLSRDSDEPLHERLPGAPGRGFARLPPPSEGDVFFDIEGDPYWGREGLEYLFGSLTDGRLPAAVGARPARRSARRSSAGSTGSRRAWSATPTCTSTTTTTTSRPR